MSAQHVSETFKECKVGMSHVALLVCSTASWDTAKHKTTPWFWTDTHNCRICGCLASSDWYRWMSTACFSCWQRHILMQIYSDTSCCVKMILQKTPLKLLMSSLLWIKKTRRSQKLKYVRAFLGLSKCCVSLQSRVSKWLDFLDAWLEACYWITSCYPIIVRWK